MVQEIKKEKYWFDEKDLIKPIDWEFLQSQPKRVIDAFELYMRGKISIGKAAEIACLHFREFDIIRSKARIPINH